MPVSWASVRVAKELVLAGEDSDASSGEYSRSPSPSIFGSPEECRALKCLQPPDLPDMVMRAVKDNSATVLTSGGQRLRRHICCADVSLCHSDFDKVCGKVMLCIKKYDHNRK